MAHIDGTVLIGPSAVMFLFAYISFKIRESASKDGYNEALSMFFLLMSVVASWTIANITNHVVLESAHAVVHNATTMTYWLTLIAGTITLVYFVLRLILNSWQVAYNRKGGFDK